jgi:ribonuclease P protein component
VLPAAHRLTDPPSFRRAARQGARAGSRTLVAHLLLGTGEPEPGAAPPRAGFVVSKAVGDAVTRNRVKRRLRHAVRPYVIGPTALPGSSILVVRAQPAAAAASYQELRSDLARCLQRASA